MLISLDVGNTSVSFALFDNSISGDPLVMASKISCAKNRSADEYAVLIKSIIELKLGRSSYVIDSAAISSVVPSVTDTIVHTAEIISGSKPFIVGAGIKTGFKIGINDPASLGADIVANVAATFNVCDAPFVVFDAGTANTITFVDESHNLIGTVITPGIRISAETLCKNAELLDSISLDDTDTDLIGKSTVDSMRSGIIYGTSLMLDGYIRNIREKLIASNSDKKLSLIATGEFSKLITANCRNKFITDEHLTHRGIASLYYKNNRK